jgi:hypothetical protein
VSVSVKFPVAMLAAGLVLVTASTSLAMAWTLPNSSTTPGAIGSSDPAIVCVRGYSRTVRPPYDFAWRKFRVSVFRAYGIPHEQWRGYTIEHLVPLALGGAPEDLRNVWPEPKDEAKRKDEVEDALVAAVCYRHTLSLQAAQAANRARLDRNLCRSAGGSRASLPGGRTMSWTWEHDDDEGYDGHEDDEHAQ